MGFELSLENDIDAILDMNCMNKSCIEWANFKFFCLADSIIMPATLTNSFENIQISSSLGTFRCNG